MCNRYTTDFQKLTAEQKRRLGVVEEISDTRIEIFPDRPAPVIVADASGARSWAQMLWGFPPPPGASRQAVTNVRNTESAFWRPYLEPAQRCLVPFTRFAEYDDASPKGRKVLRWFALQGEPVAMFAGVWRPWRGMRGPGAVDEGEHRLFAFLTTAPNALIAPIHAKAMPVILQTPEAWDAWLTWPAGRALAFQKREFPADRMELVA